METNLLTLVIFTTISIYHSVQSEEVYGRKMTGEGPTYQERQKEQVECEDCGKEMAAGSLESHRMIQHGKAKEDK